MFELEQEPTLEVCRSLRFGDLASFLFAMVEWNMILMLETCLIMKEKERTGVPVRMQLRRQCNRVVRMPNLKFGVLL